MFCGKCGTQISEDAAFCPNCGTPIMNEGEESEMIKSCRNATGQKKHKYIVLCFVAIIAIIVVSVSVYNLSGRSYKQIIDEWVTASFEGDAITMYGLFPETVIDLIIEEKDMTKSQMVNEIKEGLESSIHQLDNKLGTWTYSYKISNVEDLTQDDIKEYSIYCDYDIKAAKAITVEATVVGEEDEVTYSSKVIVIKIKNTWYLGYTESLS